jgi:adenylate kinase
MAKLIERGGYTPEKDLLVLDGIPRSPAQAAMLDDLVEVLAVVHLHPPDLEAMVQRMKQRALKEGRQDDADENVIRRRFQVYADQTAQVLRHYSNGLVKDVAADGTPIEVLNRVLDVISPMYADGFGNPLG